MSQACLALILSALSFTVYAQTSQVLYTVEQGFESVDSSFSPDQKIYNLWLRKRIDNDLIQPKFVQFDMATGAVREFALPEGPNGYFEDFDAPKLPGDFLVWKEDSVCKSARCKNDSGRRSWLVNMQRPDVRVELPWNDYRLLPESIQLDQKTGELVLFEEITDGVKMKVVHPVTLLVVRERDYTHPDFEDAYAGRYRRDNQLGRRESFVRLTPNAVQFTTPPKGQFGAKLSVFKVATGQTKTYTSHSMDHIGYELLNDEYAVEYWMSRTSIEFSLVNLKNGRSGKRHSLGASDPKCLENPPEWEGERRSMIDCHNLGLEVVANTDIFIMKRAYYDSEIEDWKVTQQYWKLGSDKPMLVLPSEYNVRYFDHANDRICYTVAPDVSLKCYALSTGAELFTLMHRVEEDEGEISINYGRFYPEKQLYVSGELTQILDEENEGPSTYRHWVQSLADGSLLLQSDINLGKGENLLYVSDFLTNKYFVRKRICTGSYDEDNYECVTQFLGFNL